jgi:pyruvate carboxylase
MIAPHTEVYEHEMPGGQYSNLQQQAKAVGLKNRWDDIMPKLEKSFKTKHERQ